MKRSIILLCLALAPRVARALDCEAAARRMVSQTEQSLRDCEGSTCGFRACTCVDHRRAVQIAHKALSDCEAAQASHPAGGSTASAPATTPNANVNAAANAIGGLLNQISNDLAADRQEKAD